MLAPETGALHTDLGIRVLAFDGGGIRGLSSLVLLRELMRRIETAAHSSGPIRPCDYFDLIIGTGTGGVSALLVGRMRMTVDKAIEAYLLMGREGFKKSAAPWCQCLRRKGALLDGDCLTRVIGDIALEYVGNRDAPLHEPPQTIGTGGRSCRTAVLSTTSAHASAPPYVFRSYPTDWSPASSHAIHEVARATTAMAGLFPPISLGSPYVKFIDAGDAGYNNPADEALNEVDKVWPGANISCLVSLGTGLQSIVKVDATWEGIMKVSRRLLGDCEKVHEQLHRRRQGEDLPYYRFNVTTGLDAAGILEWDEETSSVITAVTEGYSRKGDVDAGLNSCVSLLVGNPPAQARSALQLLKTIRNEALAEKVFKWLDAPDSSRNYNTACEKHQEGTNAWFINGVAFSHWMKGRSSFLCIYGKPGCGKTVLCSSIITYVANFCQQRTSRAYAYFFFDGRDAQTKLQLHDGLIRSLIRQFSRKCNGIPAVLVGGYDDGVQQLPTRDLEEILRHILEGFTDAFIIIDSVDECIERVKLLNWISNLCNSKADNVHLLVTTRPEEDVSAILRSLKLRSITMEEEFVNGDMEAYIDARMTEGWLSTRVEKVRSSVKDRLMTRAQGMFRWLAIQLDELQKCPNDAELYDQLERLPEGLDETYFRILERIPRQRQAAAKVFLQWTAFSACPLSLEELGEAAAFEFDREGGPNYNPLRRVQAESVLAVCASLIIESEGHVRLTHFSVKEYLISERISNGTVSYFGISEQVSHSYISRTCLAYLLRFDTLESLSDDTLPDFPLAWYAAWNWVFHVRSGANEKRAVVQNLISTLFESGVLFTNWNRLHNTDYPWDYSETFRPVTEIPSPLYRASQLGFEEVARGLLEKVLSPDARHGWDINSTGKWGTALAAACVGGYVDVVKMLLDQGADINAEDGAALRHVSREGHTDVVKILLDRGADANARNGIALVEASRKGHIDIVNMLLDWGADVNAEYSRALFHASWGGRIELVKMLLDRGADLNAGDGAALATAADRGHIEIVKMLLDRGADVNAREGAALADASWQGHIDVVKVLLDWGADINARKGTALADASRQGHIDIVKILLERGADVNADDDTALADASWQGYIDVVKILLDWGADVHAEDGRALGNASSKGHIEIVNMLLDHGADVNAEDGAALRHASREGHIDLLKILLDRGADANAEDGAALAYASGEGHIDVVTMLLDLGADVNAGSSRALLNASWGGHIEIVKMLLDRGADVNAEDGRALVNASRQGHIETVQILLDQGAEVNAWKGRALEDASREGHTDIVEILLDWGAEVTSTALLNASGRGHNIIMEMLDNHAVKNSPDLQASRS